MGGGKSSDTRLGDCWASESENQTSFRFPIFDVLLERNESCVAFLADGCSWTGIASLESAAS